MNKQKRKLADEEIEDILSFLSPEKLHSGLSHKTLPYETEKSVLDHNKNMLRKQLVKQEIYPEIIPKLKQKIEKEYYRSMIQPGESVGIFCAQSIGQQQTQTTLNTFHKAGLSETLVVSGISKFSELLGVSKNPKLTGNKIFFTEHNKNIKELRKMIGKNLLYIDVKKLIVDYKVKTVSEFTEEEITWYNIYKILYNQEYLEDDYVISLTLDKKILFNYSIDLETISNKIKEEFEDVYCYFSPLDLVTLNIHINEQYFPFPEEHSLNDKTTIISFIWKDIIPKIEKIYISGIPGINEIFYCLNNNEWIIETHGSNFPIILSLPCVNASKTTSNFVWDIYETLGIEASRLYIIESFVDIMPGVNKCHIQLLTDIITQMGVPKPISRHSMSMEQNKILAKSSFEETLDNFLKAGIYGEIDNCTGVSASIITGRLSCLGTGIIDLKLNTKMLN